MSGLPEESEFRRRIDMLLQGFDINYIKIFGQMTRTDDVLKIYQISILLGEKFMFNGIQNMAEKTVKEAE
ncbi:17929_t:CDS:2, partial [Rhizophagus irregularis]